MSRPNPNKATCIPILKVRSAATAVQWYAKIGFTKDWEHRFQPDFPAFVSVSNGDMQIFLSEHKGDANEDGLIYLAVPNIDEFVKDVVGLGANEGVVVEDSEGIGMRDVELRDPDGNRVRVGTPIQVGKD